MSDADFEILDRQTVFQGYFRVDRYRLRHRRFDGGWSPALQREVFERGQAIAALLYDPALDVVVLIEQFRVGPISTGKPAWLLEVVAGIIEQGETVAEVVEREVVEEAGCAVLAMEKICDYLPSPGACSETVELFCCRVDASQAGGIHGLAEEHEDIKVVVLSVAEAIERLDANLVNNSATIIALQWLARDHQNLRRRWLAL
ncbi:ADP-ribose pyrophosphatase [uncultured Gammaproteobacteria bacterium]